MDTDDIFVRYTDLPYSIDGTTVLDGNGDYNVYINPRESYDMQKRTLNHELSHIGHGHFYDGQATGEDEDEAESDENKKIDPHILRDVHWE